MNIVKPKLRWQENVDSYVTKDGHVIDARDDHDKIPVEEKKRRGWGSTQFAHTTDGDMYKITYSPANGWQVWWKPRGKDLIHLPCAQGSTVQASQAKAYRACIDHYYGR